eukprot:comp23145_c1_seq1/m.37404 comp23145_c1_seq1/g.37404  ORF comp23145_c1_seq1/g.37404 comp23145_c1_seq1/m.37404 type:complete len:626 (-) comp23145_c1_seq1:221-2098(-)
MGKDLLKYAEEGNYKKVQKYLKIKDPVDGEKTKVKGIDVDERTPDGKTALMIAASKNHIDIVKALIYCSALVNAREKDGNTALHYACDGEGDGALIDALLDAGAEIDSKNRMGETPIHKAAKKGREVAILKLLQRKANSTLFNSAGQTCLDVAAAEGHVRACASMVDAAPKLLRSVKSLFEAVQKKHLDVAKALLDAGMQPSPTLAEGDTGETPLHIAVRTNQVEMAKLLLTYHASSGKINGKKETPESLAANGSYEMKRLFESLHEIEKVEMKLQTQLTLQRDAVNYPLLRNKLHWVQEAPKFRSQSSSKYPVFHLVDNDEKSYYAMTMDTHKENFVAFDFSQVYFLSGIRICGNSTNYMIKDFNFEIAESLDGPWTLIKTFTAEQKGTDSIDTMKGDNQDFTGFNVSTRYCRIKVLSNYGGFNTSLQQVRFFGLDSRLQEWLKEFKIDQLYQEFLDLEYTQLEDMWMITEDDIKRMCRNDPSLIPQLKTALAVAQERENKLTWLDFGILPARYHVEGKRLPDFVVIGDPGSQEPIQLNFIGDPDVKGETQANLTPDPNGGPSRAVFKGIILSPPGNYIIEAMSVNYPELFVRTIDPTTIGFLMKDKQEVDSTFNELDDLLNFS